jgi:hypothetical protein
VLGSNEVLVWSDSYLSVKLQFKYSTTAAATAALPATVGFSNAPLHCLFSDGSLKINNRECSRVSDYAQTAFIHQLLTQSAQKQDNNSSSNAIALERRWATGNAGLTNADAIARVKSSLGVRDVDGVQTVTLSGKLPLFLTREEISGNTSHNLRLIVDPQWRNRIVRTSDIATLTQTLPLTAPLAVTALYMDVSEVTLSLRTYETNSVPRSVTKTYMYSEMFSTTRAVNNVAGSQRYSFTLPKSVSALFFTFFDNRQSGSGGDIVYAPTRFITDAVRQLNSYEIRYANVSLPSLKYQLNFEDGALDRAENNDAFYGFIQETQDLSPNGSQFSACEWASQAIMYHQVVKLPSSEASQVDIELNFTAAPGGNSILYVGAFQPQSLDITYNDVGTVNSVDVYQTSE